MRRIALVGCALATVMLAGCETEGSPTQETAADQDAAEDTSELEAQIAELEERVETLTAQRDSAREQLEALEEESEAEDPLEAEDSNEAGDFPGVVAQGEAGEFNDWEFTVTDSFTASSIDQADAPRGKYVVVTLEVTNNGSGERRVAGGFRDGFSLLHLETENEYNFDSNASLSASQAFDTNAWHLEDIGPGLSGEVPVVFDVPEDADGPMVFAMVSGSSVGPLVALDL